MVGTGAGPDLVIAGAARSGTSYLSALLSSHPQIDGGAVKEPNYFSREFGRGPDWYEGLYEPRRPGLRRLDSSASYTFPHYPTALSRLAAASPEAVVIYVVREPVARTLSHYRLHREYFGNERAEDFGSAITTNEIYLGTSDYGRWLRKLSTLYPADQVLVVPFTLVTDQAVMVSNRIAGMVGLSGLPQRAAMQAAAHRNDVVEFRHPAVKRIRRWVKRSGYYPWVRRRVGTQRLRRLRSTLTKAAPDDGLSAALGTCTDDSLEALQTLYSSARSVVMDALKEQDGRLGLGWSSVWAQEVPETNASLLQANRHRGHD